MMIVNSSVWLDEIVRYRQRGEGPDIAVNHGADQVKGALFASTMTTIAIFLPVRWMAGTHEWLGLGEFPASPLVDYLTRSASLLYAWHGGLLLVLSSDIRRYRPILIYLGIATAIGGLILLGIDIHAAMPAYWILWEGPPVTVIGFLIIWLAQRIRSMDELAD